MGSDRATTEVDKEAQDNYAAPRFNVQTTTEWFNMTRFPSRDGGPWDQAIRMQDLLIALQQRYVAGKDSIERVLEASKKSIPNRVGALWDHELVMSNFLEL